MCNNKRKAMLVYGLSALLLNSVVRDSVFHVSGLRLPGYIGTLNWIAIFSVCFVVFSLVHARRVCPVKVKKYTVVALVAFCALVAYADWAHGNRLGYWVLFGSIVPGVLLCCFKYEDIDFKLLFKHTLFITNIVLIIIFLLGIIDYFIGGRVNDFLADVMSTKEWGSMIRTQNEEYGFRMCTILGSPLMNAFYALLFIALNAAYEHTYKEKIINEWVVFLFGMLALFLTSSRVALFLGILLIVFNGLIKCRSLTKRQGVVRLIILVVATLLLVNTPFFRDTIGARLQQGFMNSSDVRYRLFVEFSNNRFGKPELFTGGGYNYSRELTAMSIDDFATLNFEYPLLMFIFDYGYVATALYYLIFFVFPEMELLFESKYYSMFIYFILFLFLQTFNMIAQFYDANLLLGFIIVLLTGIPRRPVKELQS